MKKYLLLVFTFFNVLEVVAQQKVVESDKAINDSMVVVARIQNQDTIPIVQLPEVGVSTWRLPDNRRDLRRYNRLIYHVKKVYPYAKLAGIKLNEYENQLQSTQSDKERRRIMKQAEKEINEQFGQELKDLTFTQGKILIKLIDRETSETSFTLLKELRGGVTAFFYQGFARIWGYNLKTEYDPQGEDSMIELIIHMIETGQL